MNDDNRPTGLSALTNNAALNETIRRACSNPRCSSRGGTDPRDPNPAAPGYPARVLPRLAAVGMTAFCCACVGGFLAAAVGLGAGWVCGIAGLCALVGGGWECVS